MDYEALYNELRLATIDYHAAYEDSELKAEAYRTLCEHMSGRAEREMESAAAERDLLQTQDDAHPGPNKGPSDKEIKIAIVRLKKELESPELAKLLTEGDDD